MEWMDYSCQVGKSWLFGAVNGYRDKILDDSDFTYSVKWCKFLSNFIEIAFNSMSVQPPSPTLERTLTV